MGDFNGDVRNEDTNSCTEIVMQEGITSQHRDPPSTYNRTSQRRPIDGIWISTGMTVVASGYLPFDEGHSDHRIVWMDLDFKQTFGCPWNEIPPP